MVFHWMCLVLIFNGCESYVRAELYDWLLYSNDETNTHCLLNDYRYFCHSIGNNVFSRQTNLSCTNGVLQSFLTLKQKNMTTDDLINWLIPFHIIERYANYLNSTRKSSDDNITVCNCTRNRIGIDCEYELVSQTRTIAQVILNQLSQSSARDEELPAFLVDEMPCNQGALKLEWR